MLFTPASKPLTCNTSAKPNNPLHPQFLPRPTMTFSKTCVFLWSSETCQKCKTRLSTQAHSIAGQILFGLLARSWGCSGQEAKLPLCYPTTMLCLASLPLPLVNISLSSMDSQAIYHIVKQTLYFGNVLHLFINSVICPYSFTKTYYSYMVFSIKYGKCIFIHIYIHCFYNIQLYISYSFYSV